VQTLNLDNRNITSVAGIANFTGLRELNLANNPLSHVDVSRNIALQHLNVSGLCLGMLNLTANTALMHLDVSRNHLSSLNLLGNRNLTQVNVTYNFFAHQSDIQLPIGAMMLQFTPQHSHAVTAPTCTASGFTLWTCHVGHELRNAETRPLGHLFSTTVHSPTFTQGGYTRRSCTRCDHEYTIDYVDPIALVYESTMRLRYNQAAPIFADITRRAPDFTWRSSEPDIFSVDEQGLVRYGRTRQGVSIITAVCPEGITRMEVEVTVRIAWWQWMIIIFFFGFLWY
jgi:hypothetical protein